MLMSWQTSCASLCWSALRSACSGGTGGRSPLAVRRVVAVVTPPGRGTPPTAPPRLEHLPRAGNRGVSAATNKPHGNGMTSVAAAVPAAAPTRGVRRGGHGMRATIERFQGPSNQIQFAALCGHLTHQNYSHCVQQILWLLEAEIRVQDGKYILATFLAIQKCMGMSHFGPFSSLHSGLERGGCKTYPCQRRCKARACAYLLPSSPSHRL